MAYEKTIWVNGETPAGATNMNKIENELEALDTGKADQTDLEALSTIVSGHTTAISGKQDKLTAGDNITIENNVISASGGSAQTDYTTGVEIQIGTWNNKPLYRKIITGTLAATSNTQVILDTISNLKEILNIRATVGYTNDRDRYWTYPFPVFTSDTTSALWITNTNQLKASWTSTGSWANYPISVIMEYTKTTD